MHADKFLVLLAIVKEMNIFRNDGNGNLYMYQGQQGIWQHLPPLKARQGIARALSTKKISTTQKNLKTMVSELQEDINLQEPLLSVNEVSEYIAVQNGLIHLRTGERSEHDPKKYAKTALNFSFNKSQSLPRSGAVARFFQTSLGQPINDKQPNDTVTLFLETMLYAVSNLPNAKKAIIFLGAPNTGKSVVLKLLARIVGDDAWIPLTWQDLSHRFRGSLMEHKKLVISHEMSGKPLKNLDCLKAIISGDPVVIEEKGVQPKLYHPDVKLIAAANSMPPLGEADVGGAFAERMTVVPFIEHAGEHNRSLLEELWKERDILFSLAIGMAPEFMERNLCFTETPRSKAIIDKYKIEGNSVSAFIEDVCEKNADGVTCLAELFTSYCGYCDEALIVGVQKSEFKTQLAQMGFGFAKKRVGGYENPRSCVLGLTRKRREAIICQTAGASPLSLASTAKTA